MDALMVFRAEYLPWIFIAGLSAFAIAAYFPKFSHLRKKNWEMIFSALIAGGVARLAVAEVIRFFYDRPRPFEVLTQIRRLSEHDPGGSFPSGHAVFFFAIAAVVSRYYPKTSILFFLVALNLSLARVQSGLHWPSDILGGAVIGVVVGLVVAGIARKILKPQTPA